MGGNLEKFTSKPEVISVPVAKTPTCRRMFVDRMKLEGRYKEWLKVVEECQLQRLAEGKERHLSGAQNAAMRRMGYLGPKQERAMYDNRQAEVHLSAEQKEKREIKAEKAAVKAVLTFEQAVATLRENAPDQVELDWIRAHPAMARASLDPSKPHVKITVDDIKNAPSRSAVYALQHWANHASEFYKQTMSEQKKRDDGTGSGSDFSKNMPLNDAKRILSLVGKRNGGTDEELGQRRSEPQSGDSDEAGVLPGEEVYDSLPDAEE